MAERADEKTFREIIAFVSGSRVDRFDDGSQNGMVDAIIRHESGQRGAIEFTTIAESAAMEMDSWAFDLRLSGTLHSWEVRYPGRTLSRKLLSKHIPALISALDEAGLDDAEDLPSTFGATDAWRWFSQSGLRLRRYGGEMDAGHVYVLRKGSGAAIDLRLKGLPAWLANIQAQPVWGENVRKLERSGMHELHLGLRVHESGIPIGLWMGLWNPGEIDMPEPKGMAPLSDLWILPPYGRFVIHWSEKSGWTSSEYRLAPAPYDDLFE